MFVALTTEPLSTLADQPPHKCWTRDECNRLQALGAFDGQRPAAPDLALLIEVGDSTLVFGTTVQAKLHSRVGVLDYWVVDVKAKGIIVFREPRDGQYQSVIGYDAAETIYPLAAPAQTFQLSEVN